MSLLHVGLNKAVFWWDGGEDDTRNCVVMGLLVAAAERGQAVRSEVCGVNAPLEALRAVVATRGGTLVWDYRRNTHRRGGSTKLLIAWQDCVVELETNSWGIEVECSVFGLDAAFVETLVTDMRALHKEPDPGDLFVLGSDSGEMGFAVAGDVKQDVLIADNYSPEVLAGYARALKDLGERTPRGRFVLLDGQPGTGKSFLVRAMANTTKATFVLVPDGMVKDLGGPGIVTTLIDRRRKESANRPLVLVIEDADMAIIKRGADNMGVLNALLNLTDGMLGTALDVRVVATSNAKRIEIEPALLRAGRLSAHIEIGSLTAEHAGRVYARLTDGKVWERGVATLADVYEAAADLKV